jgi:hypothetical protein
MMAMNYAGLVVQVVGLSSEKMGWQRTPKGVKHYEPAPGEGCQRMASRSPRLYVLVSYKPVSTSEISAKRKKEVTSGSTESCLD